MMDWYTYMTVIVFLYTHSSAPSNAQIDVGYYWHLTDMHWDPTYDEDQSTPTQLPGQSCNQGTESGWVYQPGMYGDYRCDPPWRLLESAISTMRDIEPDPDFLIWTGDDTPHIYDDDLLNQDRVLTIISNETSLLQQYFADKVVYSALGNHDWSPKSQLPPESDQFYERIAEVWQDWLSTDDSVETFHRGGYFTLKPDPVGPIRMVMLNTNLYYTSNRLTAGLEDPAGQFQWLNDTLTLAGENNEKVIIVSHVPPGMYEKHRRNPWFYPSYNERFLRIVTEHASTLASINMAHQHSDSFKIINDKDGQPVGSIFLAPAVTPWETTLPGVIGGAGNNPGVRLIKYDRNTGATLDIIQYYLNLTQANMDNQGTWTIAYNATEYYGVPDMSPQSLAEIASQMLEDDELFDKYFQANSLYYDPQAVCEGECRVIHYCAVTYVDFDDYDICFDGNDPTSSADLVFLHVSAFILVFFRYCFV